MSNYRNRIKALEFVSSADLVSHPGNWRDHPKAQAEALKGVLATDKRRQFAEELCKAHPDVVRVVWKFNRWHHQVDYRPFKNNRLRLKPDVVIPEGVNNYGMVLTKDGVPIDEVAA